MNALLAMLGLSTRSPHSRPGVLFQLVPEGGVAVVGALAGGSQRSPAKN
ncbi:hypothetical protein [Bordetella petrii]|nr:hypothetical protein [Bordetella petrii]